MKVHEYQAKEILDRFKVSIPRGAVASTVDGAIEAGRQLGGEAWVVKAQIHAGGRGKGGGVKIARGLDDLRRVAGAIIGMNLVTPQTGPRGQKVRKVLVAEACEIQAEYYLGIVIDRKTSLPALMASAEGGMDIEEVAARSPEKILRRSVDPCAGLRPFEARVLAKQLGFGGDKISAAAALMVGLSRAFLETDASLAEVNPLVVAADGRVMALDAKFAFDENALFRHPEILSLRDTDEEEPLELRASRAGLSYIKLGGNIGCMVNGAGLAMATLDIIKHHGGEPANFLDVGGGASASMVAEAFRIILADPDVEAILVNIFGGIMKCDVIAEGIIAAAREVSLKIPLVVRLEGTNVDEGKRILRESGLEIQTADGMAQAAQRAVQAASGHS